MHSPQDQNMKWAPGKRGEHMVGSDSAKCMLIGIGNMAVHKWSKKSQQSSMGLIGVVMDAVVSTYQSEAQGLQGWNLILDSNINNAF